VAAVGDFDADGKADLFWRHASGVNAVWLMTGAGISEALFIGTLDNSWPLVASGDFDADGKSDLFWRHSSGANAIWIMNGPR
jgi:hypothetical protein